MSWDHLGLDITRKSSGDTSSYQYHVFKLSTTNDADGCVLSTGALQCHGVWQENSTAAEYGRLRIHGLTKIYAQAVDTALTVGTYLTCDSSGHAAPSTAGTVNPFTIGYALGSLSTGTAGVITAFVFPGLASTST